jgi:hypothetical protein
VFRTTDYGATWTSIASNLPSHGVNVIVEDTSNTKVLFAGTDAGVFATVDGGARWVRLKGNMPNVPVHDLAIQPREHDLIAGTFGRAIWITDISILEQLDEATLAEDAHVFDIPPRARVQTSGWGNYDFYGDRYTPTDNEPNAMAVTYYLRDQKDHSVAIRITDLSGQPVRTLTATSRQGLNTVMWNMSNQAGREQPAGDYRVTVEIDGRTIARTATIRPPKS